MKKAYILTFMIFAGCIGTDVLDDPLVPQEITINEGTQALLLGEKKNFTVTYLNEYGIEEIVTPEWFIENTEIASITTSGIVTAKSMGQTTLIAKFDMAESNPVFITVTGSEEDISEVLIQTSASQVDIGGSIQLTASARNILGDELEFTEISWSVDNEDIASINETGFLTGKSQGEVKVTATIEDIKSDPYTIGVGAQAKTTTLGGQNGYVAEGMVTLSKAPDGKVTLILADDFKTDFALGTFIYLSNSTSGSDTKANGLDLGEVKVNGAHTFDVSAVDSGVGLNTYRYIIILCKPASITFGIGDFEE